MSEHPHESVTKEVARAIRRRFWSQPRWFRRLKRWQRWVVRIALATPLLAALTLLILARSPATRMLLIPQLEAALNLKIDADSVFVRGDGRLQINRATFRVPGFAGPAGQVLRVGRLVADVDWWSSLGGAPRVRRIDVDDVVVRVSQSVDDGGLNVAAFQPPARPARTTKGRPLELPTVALTHAAIELGEHRGGMYSTLKRMPVEGVLRPSPQGREHGYVVNLREVPNIPPRRGEDQPGFVIDGSIKGDDYHLVMDNFRLDAWPSEAVPSPSRQLFSDLGLQGTVDKLIFSYAEADGVAAELVLNRVAMNLPIQPGGPGAAGGKPLRMDGVSGAITFKRDSVLAKIKGVLEDLPYEVTLLYDGVSEDSPFTCELVSKGFRVEKYPKLLPYATDMVRYRLRTFSGPTATIDTRLLLSRGPATAPGTPGEIQFQGWMDFREGSAAFEKFPYRFEHMAGRVYVDNTKIEFADVTGVSESGARLKAHGSLSPPTDDALVDIHVQIENAILDDRMEEAFGPGRRQLLTALFNKEQYQRLRDMGLVLTPEEQVRLTREAADARAQGAPPERLAELERRLRAPVFHFGGAADVDVHVHRPFGPDVEWETNVDVRIREAGLVPEKFPLPVHARNLVCKVTDERAELVSGEFHGLRGGTGVVTGSFLLPPSSNPEAPSRPDVLVVAHGVPLDDLVIHALPGPDQAEPGGSKPFKRMLTDMGIVGVGDAKVRIAPRDALGRSDAFVGTHDDTGFNADVRITGASAAPLGGTPLLQGLDAVLRVTEGDLAMTGTGAPADGQGRVEMEIGSLFAGRTGAGVSIDAVVRASDMDAKLPVERAVEVFSAPAAADMVKLRALYDPAGLASTTTRVTIREGSVRDVHVTMTDAKNASFDMFGGRVALGPVGGVVHVRALDGPTVEYEGFHAPVTFNGFDSGVAVVHGARRYRLSEGQVGPAMTVDVTGVPFESPMIPAVLSPGIGAERMKGWSSLNPRGVFDATVVIGGIEPLRAEAFSGTVRPRSFSLELAGQTVSMPTVTGRADFNGASGRFLALEGHNDVWSAGADGTWQARDGGVSFDLGLSASGAALTPDALAVLPETLRAALGQIALKVDGPYQLEDSRLRWLVGAGTVLDNSTFQGSLSFQGASLEAGVQITGCSGRLDADFALPPGGEPPTYRIALVADRMTVAKAATTNARAVIQSGHTRGEVLVPMVTGECHGGRFSGQVRVTPIPGTDAKEYASEFQVAGVDFAPLLRDFVPLPEGAESRGALEPNRGQLDAQLSLGGIVNEPESRRGRGSLRVAGRNVRVLDLPLVVALIEVSNFVLPSSAGLDFAQSMFFIDRDRVTFEDLSIYSAAVEIRGFGYMSWPGMDLDLRFDSRAARRLPLFSWLLEGIRDQLVTTKVTGTPAKPNIRVEAMPGTRQALARAVGGGQSEPARRLQDIQRRAEATRRTIRPSGAAISANAPEGQTGGGRE
jgi:hypothetical protein